MEKRNIESIYPLNGMQQSLLFHCLRPGVDDVGFLHVRFTVEGALDTDSLEQAWSQVVHRHESLRTSLHQPNHQRPMLVVCRACDSRVAWEDLRDSSSQDQRDWFEAFCESDRQRGLALSTAPVFRLLGVQTAADRHTFIWSCHHLLLDGWSATVILRDLFAFYRARRLGEEASLSPAPSQRTYLRWRKSRPVGEATKFWENYLAGFVEPISIARSHMASKLAGQSVARRLISVDLSLPPSLSASLERAARQNQVTVTAVVYAAWALMLAAIGNSRDVLFGVTTSGRAADLPSREDLTGCFANAIPKRCEVVPQQSVATLVKELHLDQFSTQAFEHEPLSNIHQCSELAGSQELFESLVVCENLPWNDIELDVDGGLRVSGYTGGITTTCPLTLVIAPGKTWSAQCIVDQAVLSAEPVRAVVELFQDLLERLGNDTLQQQRQLIDWLSAKLPADQLVSTPTTPAAEAEESYHLPRTTTELEIAIIWEELLGITGIETHVDFLQLGGRSLVAVRMLAMIEDRLGKRISLLELIENPTIAGLAARIEDGEQPRRWKSLVPIQPHGSRPPLVVVHAGGGHVLFLRALANRLGNDQPLYGLQPVGLDGECEPIGDFETLAAHYISELSTMQPHGPYYLAGHCRGAQVAFEMVHRLQNRGDAVHLVVLDTRPPAEGEKISPAQFRRNRFNKYFRKLATGHWWSILKAALSFSVDATTNFRNKLAARARQKRILQFGSTLERKQFYLDRVQSTCVAASMKYVTKPINTKLTLIIMRNLPAQMRWQKLAKEVETIPLPIGHQTMFLEPEVGEVAGTLRQLIDRHATEFTARREPFEVGSRDAS